MNRSRIEKLRRLFQEHEVDSFLLSNPYNRRYISGFTGTAGAVLITEQEAVLFTDFRYVEQAREQAREFEIIEHKGSILEKIAHELQNRNVKRLGFEQDYVTVGSYRGYKELFTSTQLIPVSNPLERLRVIKDWEELEIIRQAANIADRAYSHILKYIQVGMQEIEVANELEFFMRKQGATSSSFDIIVASGIRSALPHGVASEKVIEQGDFVTVDFGAYYKGYCSDLTRTFAMGEPQAKLREVYEVVRQAQLRGVQQIKAGMTGREADALCRDYITEKGYGSYFGHSTGHGIGLEIHESPRLSKVVEARLEPGMVVTVEPGIYLPGLGGVRIEDDIAVTQNGNEILTHSPKELIIIE